MEHTNDLDRIFPLGEEEFEPIEGGYVGGTIPVALFKQLMKATYEKYKQVIEAPHMSLIEFVKKARKTMTVHSISYYFDGGLLNPEQQEDAITDILKDMFNFPDVDLVNVTSIFQMINNQYYKIKIEKWKALKVQCKELEKQTKESGLIIKKYLKLLGKKEVVYFLLLNCKDISSIMETIKAIESDKEVPKPEIDKHMQGLLKSYANQFKKYISEYLRGIIASNLYALKNTLAKMYFDATGDTGKLTIDEINRTLSMTKQISELNLSSIKDIRSFSNRIYEADKEMKERLQVVKPVKPKKEKAPQTEDMEVIKPKATKKKVVKKEPGKRGRPKKKVETRGRPKKVVKSEPVVVPSDLDNL